MASAILGGTFSHLHAGHRQLFLAAKPYSPIHIGVATDALANRLGHLDCPPARLRIRRLKAELLRLKMLGRCRIFPITDRFGPSVSIASLSAIIVSPETEPVAQKINSIRRSKRMKAMNIIVVPHLRAADGLILSATRIKRGDIDSEGRRKTPIRVAVGSDNPTKLAGVRAAFANAFPRLRLHLRGFKVKSGVHEQPVGFAHSWQGAQNRAAAAQKKWAEADYAVGLESGLIPFGDTRGASRPGAPRRSAPEGKHFDIQFCALASGRLTTAGSSMGFPLPAHIREKILPKGAKHPRASMGEVISKMSGIRSIGRKGGAIAYLSGGLLHRQQMVEQAVLCAFVERRSPI